MSWLFLALRVALAAIFLAAGVAKLGGHEGMVALFSALGAPWLRWVVGLWEIAGAIGLLLPRCDGLASASLALLMVAAMAVHWLVVPVGPPMLLLALFALTLLVAYRRIGQLGRGKDPRRLPWAL